jgi:hypothetical protein
MNNLPITLSTENVQTILIATTIICTTCIAITLPVILVGLRVLFKKNKGTQKTKEEAEKILERSQQEALAIIASAHENARKILSETNAISNQLKDVVHNAVTKTLENKSKQLDHNLEAVQAEFSTALSDIESEYINRYKKAVKDIEEEAKNQMGNLRSFFEKETSSEGAALQSITTEGLKIVKENLEKYEKEEMEKIDRTIKEMVKKATEIIIGKAISLNEHENIVQKALAEAKKQRLFETN